MKKYYYDLHIHSCLSPCGDADMTPGNIAGMARLAGQDIIALTDHNSCQNCPAMAERAKEVGLVFIPGMEMTSAEDAHIICLFPGLDEAMGFDKLVVSRTPFIQNDSKKFGEQQICGKDDNIIETLERSLYMASDIGLDEVAALVAGHGGVAYPAHIDRPYSSVVSALGVFPDWAGFTAAEISLRGDVAEQAGLHPAILPLIKIRSSDSHYLHQMQSRHGFAELEDPSPEAVISAIRSGEKSRFGYIVM